MAAKPVLDWTTDFDHTDPAWIEDPFPIWRDLRGTCPIAHTERYGGVYLPTRYEHVRQIAYDHANFSSRTIIVREQPLEKPFPAPPMTMDHPYHRPSRVVLLPAFTAPAAAEQKDYARASARRLLAEMRGHRVVDAAPAYAHPLALTVILRVLGLPEEDSPLFSAWARTVVITGIKDASVVSRGADEMALYFARQIMMRQKEPRDDFISGLLAARYEGQAVPLPHLAATLRLLVLAGIDTTASMIGAALWHLAGHAEDRDTLLAEPELIPGAVEEFLRAYAPTTMAREVRHETEIDGVKFERGRLVLLCFPAANRDPDEFEDPDRVDFRRDSHKHLAFGIGVHRCLGMHLARMIIRTALEEWLTAFPRFTLDPAGRVEWTPGTVRGPSRLPIVLGEAASPA